MGGKGAKGGLKGGETKVSKVIVAKNVLQLMKTINPHSSSSINPKHKQHEKNYTMKHHNQTAQSQR